MVDVEFELVDIEQKVIYIYTYICNDSERCGDAVELVTDLSFLLQLQGRPCDFYHLIPLHEGSLSSTPKCSSMAEGMMGH